MVATAKMEVLSSLSCKLNILPHRISCCVFLPILRVLVYIIQPKFHPYNSNIHQVALRALTKPTLLSLIKLLPYIFSDHDLAGMGKDNSLWSGRFENLQFSLRFASFSFLLGRWTFHQCRIGSYAAGRRFSVSTHSHQEKKTKPVDFQSHSSEKQAFQKQGKQPSYECCLQQPCKNNAPAPR